MFIFRMRDGKYMGEYVADVIDILPRGVYELTDTDGARIRLITVR